MTNLSSYCTWMTVPTIYSACKSADLKYFHQLRDYMNGIKNKIQSLKLTGRNATKWTNKCHWMRWRQRALLLPSLMDGWSRNRQVTDSPEFTHLACLSGLSNSEGQRWEQNKKEGIVLSQAGRPRHVREPSVRQKQRQRLFSFRGSVLMRASNEIQLHENIWRWRRWEVRAGVRQRVNLQQKLVQTSWKRLNSWVYTLQWINQTWKQTHYKARFC